MEKDINKMQEDIVNADMKQADKIWKVMEENLSLEYHLDRMTKDELVKVASKYKVKGITSLKKADAVIKVKNSIIEKIDITLDLLNDEGFSYLQNLINGNCIESCETNELINTTYLRNRGILFTGIIDESLKVILPIEVSELIKIKLTKELKENTLRNTEIVKLFAGMVYYYGVLTIDKFIELAESTLEYDIDYERVEMIINNGEELGFDYQIEGNMAVHIDVEEVSEIIEAQENKL